MKQAKRSVRALSVTTAIVIGAAPLAISSTTGTDAIKARQETMEGIGDAMEGLAAIAKKEKPFDPAVVSKNAETIASHFRTAATLFPEGSHQGEVETWAKTEVWSDRETFDDTLESAEKAAVALQSVSEEAAFRPALAKLGENCKSCHEMFRRPKE